MPNWLRRLLGLDKPQQQPWSHARPAPQFRASTPHTAPNAAPLGSIGPDLDGKIATLGRRAWATKESSTSALYLELYRIADHVRLEDIIKTYLSHVRRVAPGLRIPEMIPSVKVAPLIEAAGQFVEESGWAKIVLSPTFAAKPSAVRAILCHEVCHYVLEANGIRYTDRKENERLTDIAMFVLGLGRVFLAGYQQHGRAEYRIGHRLGYLTDAEYRYLEREVVRLRSAGCLVPTNESVLLGRLRNRLGGDDQKVRRYLDDARRRFPAKTEDERIRDILFDLEQR